jgi:hypothetical protein
MRGGGGVFIPLFKMPGIGTLLDCKVLCRFAVTFFYLIGSMHRYDVLTIIRNNIFSLLLYTSPFLFIRHELSWHDLLNHTLTIHFFYIILVMIMNLYSSESTFDYKSIHVKFSWQKKLMGNYWSNIIKFESRFACASYTWEWSIRLTFSV